MANISKAERERRASAEVLTRATLEDTAGQTPSSQLDTKLVRMVRDAGQYPAPHECDAHPAEVDSYRLGGWTVA